MTITMDFSDALRNLKGGIAMRRMGWLHHLELRGHMLVAVDPGMPEHLWTPTNDDMLASDWVQYDD